MASLTFGPRVPWTEGSGFTQVVTLDAVTFTVAVHGYGALMTLATVRSEGGLLMGSMPVANGCDATTALEAAGLLRRCRACGELIATWHFDDAFDGCQSCSAFDMLQRTHRAPRQLALAS